MARTDLILEYPYKVDNMTGEVRGVFSPDLKHLSPDLKHLNTDSGSKSDFKSAWLYELDTSTYSDEFM